jgi:hypothetical protein
MKNNDDIPTTDMTEIKQLINRVKLGELDQGDAQLIEKLLNFLLTIVSLLQRKRSSIRRVKELLFGMKEKKLGKDEDKNRAGESWSGAGESSQTDSPKEMASKSTYEGDSSAQGVKSLKRPGHGRKSVSEYPGARIVRLNRQEMAQGEAILSHKSEVMIKTYPLVHKCGAFAIFPVLSLREKNKDETNCS